jgi:CRP/FNR family transcriptional regulator, cyclic AMP receptor protein
VRATNGGAVDGAAAGVPRQSIIRLLDEDPELGEGLRRPAAAHARESLSAVTAQLSSGFALPDSWPPRVCGGLGALLLDGLMMRRVRLDGRVGAEILGPGDLLRPWEHEELHGTISAICDWRLLEPGRVAWLDSSFASRAARYPEVNTKLIARALRRSRYLTIMLAIVHQPRVETRISLLLWHLADRWGIVRADGVLLPKRISHLALAELVASSRPTVTVAVGRLERKGMLRRLPNGWLLSPERRESIASPEMTLSAQS